MKKVKILYQVSANQNAIDFIKNNLEEIFENYIVFENCYLSELALGTKLEADAFLALSEYVMQNSKPFIDDFSRVIKMNRSPDRNALNQISKIPPNTNVLIVNDSYESALETTYAFYEVGISHINMVAYDSALDHTGLYDNFDIAITPAEPHLVPAQISNIIDIGYRKVAFDTMFKLMKLLDLDIGIINRNLFRHIHSVVESNTAFHANYIYGYLKSEMLSHVASSNKVGMVLVDSYFRIVYANDKATQIFQVDDKNKIEINLYISSEVLASKDTPEEPIEILGEYYYFDKFAITLMDEIAGYYITLQDEADVTQAGKVLRKKGFFAKHQFKDIIHKSKDMARVIETARQIALTEHTVLIRGESGTGKELMAQSIHNASYRNKFPFVAINCAALPDSLLESELFGYEAGAFTGAHAKGKIGLFEQANHGTIFLDEIGDISPKLQARLLRTIQERQIMRIGSDRFIDIDIRLITATNRNLEQAVRDGTFRSDLFFRLNVLPIVIPPLRKRKDDIIALLQYFLGNEFKNITADDISLLLKYDWPGNIRELENAATYYQTLLSFPEYILEQRYADISYTTAIDIQHIILQLISHNTVLSHGIGRTSLLRQLEKNGISISDGKLRELLEALQSEGKIEIGKGRYGTRVTATGQEFLQSISSNASK